MKKNRGSLGKGLAAILGSSVAAITIKNLKI